MMGLLLPVIALLFISYPWILPMFDANKKLNAMALAIGGGDVNGFTAYLELVESGLKQFVADRSTGNYDYDFTVNTITGVKKMSANQYEVDTNEGFVFNDTDGFVYDYDCIKRYHVDEVGGRYELVSIDNIDTRKK